MAGVALKSARAGRPRNAPSPPAALAAQLDALVEREPALSDLLNAPPGDAVPEQRVLPIPSGPPLTLVHVPMPGNKGRLWVSRLPGGAGRSGAHDVQALLDAGIDHVVCLVPVTALADLHAAETYLLKARQGLGDRFLVLDIADHAVPEDDASFESAVASTAAALFNGANVLVHCVGGCGRSGMFCASIMVRFGEAPRQAIERFRTARRCGPETLHQLAYVYRYAERAGGDAPRLVVSTTRDGAPKTLARGGLSVVQLGRLRWPDGRSRRVAVKHFGKRVDDAEAAAMQARIEALRTAGVRLPRMGMYKKSDGSWVQVTPLFGATARGSRLHQPASYYQSLEPDAQAFVAEQLTRVANAGYSPSLDLFLVFKDRTLGLLPADLDLITPLPDAADRARELVKRMIMVGRDVTERTPLLAIATRTANADFAPLLGALVEDPNSPFHRLWHYLR